MNGIDFILRDRTGWTPPVPLPRRRLRWVDPKQEAMRPEELAFIKGAKGRLTAKDLGECYGVSPQTISNIWAGRCPAGPVSRPERIRVKRKQP
ncbi:MarR family transcriptional regulator [Achromobacter animicus]|uniref:MarR family transcriptional regulator n=1 Tax=Achromobacter animicus TaxID=1389935 RepID=UPI001467DF55|nr:MarR family transcriptional regulator [Achromobacter animicus]CAB3849955.1 hypothetical protein LMG26691_01930 [Achromobacter animicus]